MPAPSTSRPRRFLDDASSWAGGLRRLVWPGPRAADPIAARRRERELERRLVEQLHPRRMQLQVAEVIRETVSTSTLRLRRLDGDLPPFRPGQYLTLQVEVNGARTTRPFSISSAPGRDYLDVTVRATSGGLVSPYLAQRARPGLQLQASGPEGQFRHEPLLDGDELVFLAGGSGITPFMSMLRDQAARGFPLRITLLYGSRQSHDVIFGEELRAMAGRFHQLRYRLVLSDPDPDYQGPRGLLGEELIRSEIRALLGPTFFVCGPPEMIALSSQALARLGVPRQRVRLESFGLPARVAALPGWPAGLDPEQTFTVQVEGAGSIPARAGEPLLTALERAGIAAPSLCRTGSCGTCRCRVTGGAVFQPDGAHVREADRAHGYVHSCAAYPVGPLRVRLQRG